MCPSNKRSAHSARPPAASRSKTWLAHGSMTASLNLSGPLAAVDHALHPAARRGRRHRAGRAPLLLLLLCRRRFALLRGRRPRSLLFLQLFQELRLLLCCPRCLQQALQRNTAPQQQQGERQRAVTAVRVQRIWELACKGAQWSLGENY